MKISVIGGGSTYTPELIDGLAKEYLDKKLNVDQLWLMDINEKRLKIVGEFSKYMLESKGCEFKVELTTSLEKAIEGANFVLCQFRVGGNEARLRDYLIAKKHNLIGQETTGIGGFAKAMRTLPVIEKISKVIQKKSPKAWLINFTNPVSIISQYLANYTSLKWVGLCNVPKDMSMSIANIIGLKDDSKIFLDYIGLNHLSWVRKVLVDGRDVTKKVINYYKKIKRMKNIPEEYFLKELIAALNAIPSPYLLYYYNRNKMLEKQKKEKVDRATKVLEIEKKLLEIYKQKKSPHKPKLLEERGGAYYSIVAVKLISAIYNNTNEIHILNTVNNNTILDLEKNDSIETNCKVNSRGIYSISKNDKLPLGIKGLIQQVKDYERLVVKAFVERSKKLAYLAIVTHPLVGDSFVAKEVLEDIVASNQKYFCLY